MEAVEIKNELGRISAEVKAEAAVAIELAKEAKGMNAEQKEVVWQRILAQGYPRRNT